MTAKTIKLPSLPTGLSVSCKVRNVSSLALLETVALTEGSGDGIYTGTVTGAHAGQLLFEAVVSGFVVEKRVRTILDAAATFIILSELDQLANSGRGAHLVTITITDGTDPLENATVRVAAGVLSETLTTGANGEVEFALDSATYTVTATKPGYGSSVASLVIAGTTSQTYALTPPDVTPPASALVATGLLLVLDESAQPEADVTVNVQLVSGPGTAGYSLDTKVRTATSDEVGLVEFANLIRGATYAVWSGSDAVEAASPFAVRSSSQRNEFTVPNADSFDIAEFTRLDAEA